MAMRNDFQLGLLPERKMDWRTLATSYGLEFLLLLFLLNVGILFPDTLQLKKSFHMTELVPTPSVQPKPLKLKPPPPTLHAKLLPPAVFSTPKLIVPHELRPHQQQQEVAPPKVALNTFAPAALKITTPGGARPALIHTGDFTGSSVAPTVNAPVQKVQTGGFGDPNGLPGQGKPNAKLVASATGSFDMPQGAGFGNGSGGAKGIRGTVASAGFGNGIASPGIGEGRSNGRGSGVQTAGFAAQEVSHNGPKLGQQPDLGPPTTSVEITYKPQPVYTEEARGLKLEGEVLLEVMRSEEHTSELQSHVNLVCRLLLEKKKKKEIIKITPTTL